MVNDLLRTRLTSEAAKTRLSQLLSSMREVFWIAPADPRDGLIVNPAYEKVFGLDAEDLKERRWAWLSAVAHEDRGKLLEMIRKARAGEDVEDTEVRIRHKDGSRRWLQCRISLLEDPDLGPGAVMGLAMDVTQRKQLQNRLLDVAEHERQRIGMELHDDLCQRLAGLRLKAGVLASAMSPHDNIPSELASQVAEELTEAMGIARLFARGLAPVHLDRLGLDPALRDLAETLKKTFGVECRLILPKHRMGFNSDTSAHVFRVIQELAMNAAKHSQPDWIEIQIRDWDGVSDVTVTHNGSAFDPDGSETKGMGLHLLQQRLDVLGTSLRRGKRTQKDGEPLVTASFELESPQPL